MFMKRYWWFRVEQMVVLLWESIFRPPVENFIYEFPAGGIDEGGPSCSCRT